MPLLGTRGAASARGFGLFSSLTTLTTDPYFKYVTMLLHGDGTNGAQNNTFLDSSTNNFTITRNGNTTQGSFSPYGSNWSNYFDGSSYLTVANNAAFNLGTGDFTIEFSVFSSGGGRYQSPVALYNPSTNGYCGTGIDTVTGQFYFSITNDAGTVQLFSAYYTIPGWSTNQWFNLAVTRSGTTISWYSNGTRIGTATTSESLLTAPNVIVGGLTPNFNGNPVQLVTGYLSNVRIIKGTALYTGSSYTVSTTPLTAVSGTSLLTCQSNRFIDNSTNAFTITVTGTPSVQRFSPFSPTAAYSTSVIGGSGYFDGSGDNLSIANTANLQFGTSDYTIEGFVYPTANDNTDKVVISKDASGQRSWFLGLRSSYGLAFFIGGSNQTGTNAIALNSWTHFAVVRSGTSAALFINGTRVATFTDANNYTQTAPVEIGGNNPVFSNPFTGFITNARLVKGTAVYSPSSTTITVPTAPLTAVSNTQLLCNMTNGAIFDNAMMNNLETVGNAQISTSVVKYGTGSLAFDGSGDDLRVVNAGVTTGFGTGDFTVEFWVYANTWSSFNTFVDF